MSFAISNPIQYRLYGSGTGGNGILEVRISFFEQMISLSPVTGRPHQILHQTPRIPYHNALVYLTLRQLQSPLFYITQFLSSLNIRPAASQSMARQIASHILQMPDRNGDRNFHIIAEVDFIRVIWLELEEQSMGAGAEETVVFDEAPPALKRGVGKARGERLKSEEKVEDLGDCSICLDELSCEKREVIRIPCGHVYHESCIFKWLKNHNSCPLCRKPLPLKEDEEDSSS
ncbi:E3 ubiquitin-protein ligase RNF181-like protein [Cucumis melo var. makuwa]|uniref:RING-type E3 ubiquitin transferase n=2 Tax=Cucumis melo TaxID=3656 RepID=A0A1S4DUZ4_CUCME|nr:uncharacterized protein LOC107990564 [Cucumis melo]KAA0035774.1 E3 ubiquitin-protein ligase RNF181-like protein [Cucumis melo var. makuwa]TYK29842.1 E3 ubiquitin-protein ligase RNF181-like protein [Cucumis melo var. makuwa]